MCYHVGGNGNENDRHAVEFEQWKSYGRKMKAYDHFLTV